MPLGTGGNPPLSYSISGLPPGLALNTSTRRITGTITGASQVYNVEYTVTDDNNSTDVIQFVWLVMGSVFRPTGLFISDNAGDELYTFPDPADLTTFTVQDLPPGLTIPQAMTWTGTVLLIVDSSGDELYTFPDPADLTTFTVQDLPGNLTSPVAMTWTGTVLLIVDTDGDELYTFPDPADLTTFTVQDLPGNLTSPAAMTWTGTVLLITDFNRDDLYTFPDPADLTTFTVQDVLPPGLTIPQAMTWTGTVLLIVDTDGDELYTFPDPADLTTFTVQDLPGNLTSPSGAAFIPEQPSSGRIRVTLVTGVPEVVARVRTSSAGDARIQTELSTGVPEVTARVRTTAPAVDDKTLYGTVYRVTDDAGQSDEEAFVWTICPAAVVAARIQTELQTGVPEVVARVRTTPQEPHCQVSTLPAPSDRSATSITYSGLNLLLDDELTDTSGDSYAQTIILTSAGNCFFLTANRMNNQGSGSGPQMAASWEVNPQAIVLMNGPGNRLEMPGPNWPGHAAQDPDEPFFWALASEQDEALETFLANFDPDVPTILMLCDLPLLATDARIQTELVTGVPGVTARVRTSLVADAQIQTELVTGIPESVARVRTTAAEAQRIQTELETGVPEVMARVRTTAPATDKTLYGVVYTVTDAAGQSDEEAFVWGICPAARIQGELVTGVPAVTARVRTSVPGAVRIETELQTGVPEVTARVRTTVPEEERIRTELVTGVPEVVARVRTTAPTVDTKTLYGTVYRVTDAAGRSDEEAFVWTICPREAIRIIGDLTTGVPESVARVRTEAPAAAPEEVEDRVRAVAGAAVARTGRSFSSSLPPDDEQLFPLAAKLGQIANIEAAWFLGRPAFLADVSVPRSFELVPNPGEVDEVNVNKGRALPPPVHEDADYLV